MGKSGFVPRAPAVRVGSTRLGWETGLSGWSGLGWAFSFTGWTALGDPARGALVRVARRATRKGGVLTLRTHPGRPTTGRPVGTRMGKGKGKPRGHLRWFPRGGVLLGVRGPRPPGWGVLPGRTRAGKVTRLFW